MSPEHKDPGETHPCIRPIVIGADVLTSLQVRIEAASLDAPHNIPREEPLQPGQLPIIFRLNEYQTV